MRPRAPQPRAYRFATATTEWLRPRPGPGVDKRRTVFVDVCRSLAALLVVYTHVDWVYLGGHELRFGPFHWLDRWLFVPLGFGAQGPGGVSVPVFFLISGFVVTPMAVRRSAGRFGVNRFFRIVPLLWFAVALGVAVVLLGQSPLVTGDARPVTGSKIVSNALLYNFLSKPIDAYVAVAWTMLIECLFYLVLLVLAPLLRKAPVLAILLEFDVIIGVLLTHDWFGASYRALASIVAYLLVPVLGQVLWAVWQRHMPAWAAGVLLVLGWLLFRWAGQAHIDGDYVLRPYPVAIAVVLFVLGMLAEPHLRERRFWLALSERSYSIYLLHGVVVFPVLDVLRTVLPLGPAILLALISTAVVVELSYRLVERPSHQLGRRLSRVNWRGPFRRAGASAQPDRSVRRGAAG